MCDNELNMSSSSTSISGCVCFETLELFDFVYAHVHGDLFDSFSSRSHLVRPVLAGFDLVHMNMSTWFSDLCAVAAQGFDNVLRKTMSQKEDTSAPAGDTANYPKDESILTVISNAESTKNTSRESRRVQIKRVSPCFTPFSHAPRWAKGVLRPRVVNVEL